MEPRNRCQGINSASLCSLAGRYDNPIPSRCLAPIEFLKIPALDPKARRWIDSRRLVHCKDKIQNFETNTPRKGISGLSPNFDIHASVGDLCIPTIGLPILLEEMCRTILGLYKSLTDTWMWKLGLRPRYSQKRNAKVGCSLQCESVISQQQNDNVKCQCTLQDFRGQLLIHCCLNVKNMANNSCPFFENWRTICGVPHNPEQSTIVWSL